MDCCSQLGPDFNLSHDCRFDCVWIKLKVWKRPDMVDSNLVVRIGHVIEVDMLDWACAELAGNTLERTTP